MKHMYMQMVGSITMQIIVHILNIKIYTVRVNKYHNYTLQFQKSNFFYNIYTIIVIKHTEDYKYLVRVNF